MGRFEPVVIEKSGGHYAIRQGSDTLFMIPEDVFDAYEADAVFPPKWTAKAQAGQRPAPRYILWHHKSGELLMGSAGERPPLLAEVHGSHPFRSYLQAFWLPELSRMIIRVYWNPENPSDAFDTTARKENCSVQKQFIETIMRLMPPKNIIITLNAVDRYMRVKGLDGTGLETDPSQIYAAHLTPPSGLADEKTGSALTCLLTAMAGRVYPTITTEQLFLIETLSQTDLDDAKAKLAELGLTTDEKQQMPH